MAIVKDSFEFKGKTVHITWIPGESYESFSPITQAYGFCFKGNKLLMIQTIDLKHWQVPGGTVEPGEKPEDTLIREGDEEANIRISGIKYLGAQMCQAEGEETIYQLRFAARIDKLLPRKLDPAANIIARRRFVNPDDFARIADWGVTGEAIAKEAKRKLNII
jgi:ADP-ribose pyrophosphatase YjhB (NUDIX family)